MAMKRSNPFPGMNPWLEEHWPGVHSLLISLLAMQVSPLLPDDLAARPEECVTISSDDEERARSYRADIAVTESWQEGIAPSWTPSQDSALEARAAVPVVVQFPSMTERWIEIRDATGRLVTVIEIISPTNRSGPGLTDYLAKRRTMIASSINFVEIDLLLGGQPLVPEGIMPLPRLPETHYAISIKRIGDPARREIYRPLLREPLPVIRIPLRPGEKDIFIDLQPLINQVHEAGRYHMLDYSRFPNVPLTPDDHAWLQECLAA